MKQRLWSRSEQLLALNLYCKLPFGQYHQTNPEVIKLANGIGRTPSAIAMKLVNFASLDDVHRSRGVTGLSNVSKSDKAIWSEFTESWNKLADESEQLWDELISGPIEGKISENTDTDIEATVKIRRGQRFFRKMILANYLSRCCVCGIPIASLLTASHIIPWSLRIDLRLNPHNGLCLCALHDRAFDSGLITISDSYTIIVSNRILESDANEALSSNFKQYVDRHLKLLEKFLPELEFLAFHRQNLFNVNMD